MTSTAYLLIAHGSRDPRPQAAMNRLAQLVREQLSPAHVSSWSGQDFAPILVSESHQSAKAISGQPLRAKGSVMTMPPLVRSSVELPKDRAIVGTAVLEFGLLPLHEQICEFGRRLSSAGIQQLRLVPLFLLRGKHVMDDIPGEVEKARRALNGLIELSLETHIGGHPDMPGLISERFAHTAARGRLIVAHGSRRPRGNRAVDSLAKSLDLSVAYWMTESDLEHKTIQLMQQGCSTLAIFPYFLFTGGITDAVAQLTEELAERFPRTKIRLLPPLGATADLANLIVTTVRE